MTLSPIEQKIYKAFYNKVCTLEDVSGFLKNYRQAVVACKNLVEKNYFKRIKGGLYAAVPFELAPDANNNFLPDRYKIADRMIGERFLSHHTALELHCGAAQIPNVYISSPSRVPSVNFCGVDYLIITTKHFFGFTDLFYQGSTLRVSDKERTIIDCLRQMKYASNFDEIRDILPKLSPINFDTLLNYLRKIDEKTLYSRVGYTMDILRDKMATPEGFLEEVRERLPAQAAFLDPVHKGKEWKVK